jgi:nitroreductase/NAD-dependent dihydropyrimidine dehydrogenase PreA subunit
MAIPTSRVKEKAEICINYDKCNSCGRCVSVCKDFSLILVDGKLAISDNPAFGCIGCGHCMAICPENAVEIYGRTLSPDDVFDLPSVESASDYRQLFSLFQRRRSIREFRNQPVEHEVIDKILKAAVQAPMGLPPSDVNVLILDTKEKNFAFAKDFCEYLKSIKWMASGWFLGIMKPFWSKSNDELFRNFIRPLFDIYIGNMDKGINHVNYDPPLSIYFYGSPYCDPADPIIAATAAMYAAESLGLGTCMIGGVHPFLQNGKKAKKFREAHEIKYPSREGLFVIFGYPAVKYHKGINRTFSSVSTLN